MRTRPERLEKALARVAREQGIDQERLRRWVSFLALCGVLERAVAEGVIGSYYLKGGVAMELRFAQLARATKDLDLALAGDRKQRLRSLSDSLRLGFDQFTFRLKSSLREMESRGYDSRKSGWKLSTAGPHRRSKSRCFARSFEGAMTSIRAALRAGGQGRPDTLRHARMSGSAVSAKNRESSARTARTDAFYP